MDALLSAESLQDVLSELQGKVKKQPADPKHRVFLFQLLSVLGQWERAATQLAVVGDLDAAALAMVQTYREALQCEALREEVFQGKRTPLVFGEPQQWIALLVEALKFDAEGAHSNAADLRNEAFEMAPTTSGSLKTDEEHTFDWVADADMRLGPVLEAVINGKYYWVPFSRIRTIVLEPPEDLRDLVWTPAFFTWSNGGEAVGLIPTRYQGSENSESSAVQRSKRTEWVETAPDFYVGMGQRMLATDSGEFALMDVREITLDTEDEGDANAPEGEPEAAE